MNGRRILYWVDDDAKTRAVHKLKGPLEKKGWALEIRSHDTAWADTAREIEQEKEEIIAVAIDLKNTTNKPTNKNIKWHQRILRESGFDLAKYENEYEFEKRDGCALAVFCAQKGIYWAWTSETNPTNQALVRNIMASGINLEATPLPNSYQIPSFFEKDFDWLMSWLSKHPDLDPFESIPKKLSELRFAGGPEYDPMIPHTFQKKNTGPESNAEKLRGFIQQRLGEDSVPEEYDEMLHDTLKRWFGMYINGNLEPRAKKKLSHMDLVWLGKRLMREDILEVDLDRSPVTFQLDTQKEGGTSPPFEELKLASWADGYAKFVKSITEESENAKVFLQFKKNTNGNLHILLRWESLFNKRQFENFKDEFQERISKIESLDEDVPGLASNALMKLYRGWHLNCLPDIREALKWKRGGNFPEKNEWEYQGLSNESNFLICSFDFGGGSVHYLLGVLKWIN